MKRILWFLYFFIIQITYVMQASQYGPNTLFQKPYEPDSYVGNFIGTFCAGQTDKAYNRAGQVVPFLQNYGKEDLFLHFIDPTISHDTTTKIGTIDFAGQLKFQCTNLSYYKNIMHHLFIGLGTVIQNLDINKIQANVEIKTPLTENQNKLLSIFESKIPKTINTSGILSTYLEFGYNQKFTHFENLDFLQALLKTALLTPQWIKGSDVTLLQYPFTGNSTFGYQIIGNLVLGLNKYLNFGIFGTINTFQAKAAKVSYNEHTPNNHLFISKETLVYYTPGTVYNGAFYWEINEFLKHFTLTCGASAMYGTPRKIKPINPYTYEIIYPKDISFQINHTLEAWNLTSIFFEIDYNFLTQENPQGPCLTLFFNLPVSGYHYPKTTVLGGEFGLLFNYHF